MEPVIIDRGRGPEIKGTRITVYDIMDYEGDHHTYVAAMLDLSSDEVIAVRKYIDEHKDEVTREYQKILERCARGNPPELQAKLDAIHVKYQVQLAQRREELRKEQAHAGNNGR